MLKPRWRRLLALAGVALVAQGAAGAATATSPIRLTQPVQASKTDTDPTRMYSGPSIAVDPDNPLRVVASYTELHSRRCGLMRSTDGGQSWTKLDAFPGLASYPFCLQVNGGTVQAPVAFGRSSRLYMLLAGWDIQDGAAGRNGATLLARSSDLGDTWQTTVVHDARGKDGDLVENQRPVGAVAVDTHHGNDDVVYVSFPLRLTGPAAPNADPTNAMVAVSTDGGRTFADAQAVSKGAFQADDVRNTALAATTTTTAAPNASTTTTTAAPQGSRAAQPNQVANFGGSGPRVSVDGKGTAYVMWASSTQNITPSPPAGLFLSKSTDHGRSWTTSQVAPFAYTNSGTIRFAVNPRDDSLHIVYGLNPTPLVSGSGDVFERHSTDGGRTWSDARNVTDDDPKAMVGQFQPTISIAPNGRIDVAFWDTRADPGIQGNDVFYTSSTDNGATWSKNTRITDRTVDRKLGVWSGNFGMSSPPGLASSNQVAVIAWDDTRNSDVGSPANAGFGGGVQDVYTAAVQYKALGGGTSKAVKSALAGVIGLLLVALVLLTVSVSSKRRTGGPARRDAVSGKSTARVS